MAKKDDIELEDFDFDNFDFDIPDFNDPDPTKDDRKAVTRLGSGFLGGIKSELTSPDTAKRVLRNALPKGYAQGLNVAEATVESAKQLYNTAAEELRPVTDVARRSADKLAKKLAGNGKNNWLSKKLEDFAQGGQGASYDAKKLKADYEDSQIAQALGEMFKLQADAGAQQQSKDDANRMIRDKMDADQHKDQMGQLNVIAKGISRLVGYQDNILIKYQQKSLELQYRHYFVAKDLLDITNVQNEKMMAAMEKVVKNTALPDAVKINKSELATQMLKQRLAGAGLNTISNWSRNYREQLMQNVTGLMTGLLSPLADAAGMMGGGDDLGMDGATNSGMVAGQALTGSALDYLSIMANPYLERHEGLRRGGAKLGRLLTGAPQKLNRWAKSETKGYGAKSTLTQLLKDVLPKFYLNDKVADNHLLTSDQPAIFDRATHRSINEVIPGYLAQINHWVKGVATGKLDDDIDTWNVARGGFSKKSVLHKDIKSSILQKPEADLIKSEVERMMDEIDKDKTLSESNRKVLLKQITGDLARGEAFDPRRYTKRENYRQNLSDEAIDELRYFFRNEFGLDYDGNEADNSTAYHERMTKLQDRFDRMQNIIPAVGDRLRGYAGAFGLDSLRELGLISGNGRNDRIDFDKIWDLIDGEDDKKPAGQPPGNRGGKSKRRRPPRPPRGERRRSALPPAPGPGPLDETQKLGGTQEVSDILLNRYLGGESAILGELRAVKEAVVGNRVNDLIQAQLEMSNQMLDVLGYMAGGEGSSNGGGEGAPGTPPAPGGKKGNRLWRGAKWTLGKAWKGTAAYARMWGNIYKGAGMGAWWTAKKTSGLAWWATKKAFAKDKVADIYVKGQEQIPALRKQLIEAGEYIDENTKKVIQSAKDITGPVRDKAGNLIIDAEEYARGLKDVYGKSLAGKVASLTGKLTKGYLQVATMPYALMWKGAKAGIGAMFNKAKDKVKDGYLNNETIPRIRAVIMEEGGYFDQATKKVIRSYEDIKGTVVDKAGNIVVTAEELRKSGGFRDFLGKKVEQGANLLGDLKEFGKTAASLPFAVTSWWTKKLTGGLKGIKGLFTGKGIGARGKPTGDPQEDMVTLSYHQTSIQDQILKHLKARFPLKKKVMGDSDGDGVRDNSWQDILKSKEKKKADEAAAAEGKKGNQGGLLGGLSGLFSKFFKRQEEIQEDQDDGDINIGGSIGGDGEGKGKGKGKVKPKRTWKNSKGFWGKSKWLGSKAWGATKWLGKKAGGLALAALPFLGEGALATAGALASGAGTALAGLGGLLAGVVSAPVLLGAAAVGGIGYGVYKMYKYLNKKLGVLGSMRMAQYGVDPRDTKDVEMVMKLEEVVGKAVRYGNDGELATLDDKSIGPLQVFPIFGIDPHETGDRERIKRWILWFQKRFKPVFLSHATTLHTMAKGAAVFEADDKLPKELGLDYVNATKLDQLEDVYDDTDNSPFSGDLSCDARDVKSWVSDAEFYYKNGPGRSDGNLTKDQAATKAAAAAAAKGATDSGVKSITGIGPGGKPGVMSRMWDGMKSALTPSNLAKMALTVGGTLLGGIGGGIIANWIGGKLFKPSPAVSTQLDAAMAARFKIYGLVEMEKSKADNLMYLEDQIWPIIEYDNDGKANVDKRSDEFVAEAMQRFGVSMSDTRSKTDWYVWYRFRFLPVMMQYATSVRTRASIDAKDAVKKLKGAELAEVLQETCAAQSTYQDEKVSIWDVKASPWPGYTLNADKESIKGNIDAIKGPEEKKKYTEQFLNALTPKNNMPISKDNTAKTNFEQAPSPLAGYRTGEISNKSSILQKMGASFDKSKGGIAGSIPFYGAGVGSGTPIVQPGNGTGGDINQVPTPTGDGWNGVRDTIIAAANMAGFDPATAATVAAIESSFKPNVKAGTSSATGLFQFIGPTWKSMIEKYASKYGIDPRTPPTDARANALMGMEYLKENADYLKKRLGRQITDTDLYLAHFLGPNGAGKFLSSPPNDVATKYVDSNVPSANSSIFFANGRPRTVGEVVQEMSSRLNKGRRMHDLTPGQSVDSPKVDPAQAAKAAEANATAAGDNFSGPTGGGLGSMDPETAKAMKAVNNGTYTQQAPSSAPAMGAMGADAVAAGKDSAAASGTQAAASTGLTTTVADSAPALPTPQVQAAIAQKQSSKENEQLTTSVDSVTAVLNAQLQVSQSMDQKLGMILQLMQARGSASNDQPSAQQAATPNTPAAVPPLLRPSSAMPAVPVSVARRTTF